MGIRLLQIHHAVDHQERLYPSNHDKYGVDHSVVLFRDYLLVLWQDIQEVDAQLESSYDVSVPGMSEI